MSAAEQLKWLPDHYLPIMPYLVVKDADGFIEFIKTVFAAEEKLRVNMDDGSIMYRIQDWRTMAAISMRNVSGRQGC